MNKSAVPKTHAVHVISYVFVFAGVCILVLAVVSAMRQPAINLATIKTLAGVIVIGIALLAAPMWVPHVLRVLANATGVSFAGIKVEANKQIATSLDVSSPQRARHAAAICYKWENGRLLFLLVRTSSRRRWIMPKGDATDSSLTAAIATKRAYKEAGAVGLIDDKALTTFKYKNGAVDVEAFLLQVTEIHSPIESGRDPTWFAPEEAQQRLSEERDPIDAQALRQVILMARAYLKG